MDPSSMTESQDSPETDATAKVDAITTGKNVEPQKNWRLYLQVKNNRSKRLQSRLRRTKTTRPHRDTCPMCNSKLTVTRSDDDDDSDETIDVESVSPTLRSQDSAACSHSGDKAERDNNGTVQEDASSSSTHDDSSRSAQLVIESLKQEVKDLQQQAKSECLICLGPYKQPLVSISCWHVHCEVCWMQTMSIGQACPQCNMPVTSPALKRIYL